MGWVLLHQLLIKKITNRLAYTLRQPYGDIFSVEAHSSLMTLPLFQGVIKVAQHMGTLSQRWKTNKSSVSCDELSESMAVFLIVFLLIFSFILFCLLITILFSLTFFIRTTVIDSSLPPEEEDSTW